MKIYIVARKRIDDFKPITFLHTDRIDAVMKHRQLIERYPHNKYAIIELDIAKGKIDYLGEV